MDKPLWLWVPPKISPSKRASEKYKPRGLFSEFYSNCLKCFLLTFLKDSFLFQTDFWSRYEMSSLQASSPILGEQSERASKRHSSWGKESLQQSLINFHFYFAQTKGNTIGWKIMFRKSKLIDSRPGWHPLNLNRKCRNTMLLSQKPLNSLQKKRPVEEENHFSFCEKTVVCVKFGYHAGGWDWNRELVSALKADGLVLGNHGKATCESVGLLIAYYKPRTSLTDFVVLVDEKSQPLISCRRFCQAPRLVLKTRVRDSSAQFKRCLSTSASSPQWIPPERKIQKHVHDSVAV